MVKAMARSTNREINKAIKKATGYDIKVFKSYGCCSFYSDDNETEDMLARFYSTTEYVNSINQLTVQQWVDSFKFLLKENNVIPH